MPAGGGALGLYSAWVSILAKYINNVGMYKCIHNVAILCIVFFGLMVGRINYNSTTPF